MNPPAPVEKPASPVLDPVLDGAPAVEGCISCKYWHREQRQNVTGVGAFAACRRYPVTNVLRSLVQQNALTKQMSAEQVPANLPHPLVHMSDWCGEYSEVIHTP